MALFSNIEADKTSLLDHNIIEMTTVYNMENDENKHDAAIENANRLSDMSFYHDKIEWKMINDPTANIDKNNIIRNNNLNASTTTFHKKLRQMVNGSIIV